MSTFRVVFLPGSVLPTELAYGGLLQALGPVVDALPLDLAVFDGERPSANYSLDTEVTSITQAADTRGWDRFGLVGYSGGGAAALAFAAQYPDRLSSLALLEPAWAGDWDWSAKHAALWTKYDEVAALPTDEFMAAFMQLNVLPEARLPTPPPGPPPPWMAKRPAGIQALMRTFKTYQLDRPALTTFTGPVLFVLGGLSNPDQFREIADRLGTVFQDFTVTVYPTRHHFDPPHRSEPEQLAESLLDLWARGRPDSAPS